jgi:leukotriene-A4 hydrolase
MRYRLIAMLLLFGVACAASAAAPPDAHSYANVKDFRTTHLALDLRADFAKQVLQGHVDLHLERLNPETTQLVLDTRDLTINRVELLASKPQSLKFALSERNAKYGSALTITVPASVERTFKLRIHYTTSPKASGLQWLSPSQTAGKRQPFLYSQSQAVHARSWIPLQDTPQIRHTYEARIRTPKNLLAVMSADNDPAAERDGDYSFKMPQPIPSYLMALAIGDLSFKSIGARTGVYAEPSMLAASVNEFADVESMLVESEKLFGPYRWGRYDLLILPPSFMWGGMENPRLSFITPTVIAGDRSLVSIIAHELAHSWSGNLVTNDSWDSVWLNEGFTTYLERRIVDVLYGADRREMEDMLGMQSLQQDIADLIANGDGALTHLRMNLQGRDPDDAFSDVPYEKGRFFLGFLESRLGRERLDAFLRGYFDHFAFQRVSTEQFLEYLDAQILKAPNANVSQTEVSAWIDEPGLPASASMPQSDAFAKVDAQRDAWLKGDRAAKQLDTAGWNAQQWLRLLKTLPPDVSVAQLAELDAAFNFTAATNNVIAHSWLKNAIRAGYAPAYGRLERHLTTIGRRLLVKDLYEELMKVPGGPARARAIYVKARPLYQVPLVAQLDELLDKSAVAR